MGSRRIPASRQTGERIEELLAGGGDHDVRSDLIRLGVRKLLEEVLEGEVEDRLGRVYYGRGDGERPGYRNGYRRGRLKSAEGAIEYAAPQVSDLGEPYRSRVRERLEGRTEELERLAVEMYARGLSTRDIEVLRRAGAVAPVGDSGERGDRATLGGVRGVRDPGPVGAPAPVPLRRRRRRAAPPWARPRGGPLRVGHRPGGQEGPPGTKPGDQEDTESCRAFFQDMRRRGLGDPLLVVTDGAPGLIRAVEECFPRSHRQRCLAHRMRNLEAKVPEH